MVTSSEDATRASQTSDTSRFRVTGGREMTCGLTSEVRSCAGVGRLPTVVIAGAGAFACGCRLVAADAPDLKPNCASSGK
eukprot:3848409-Pleurochrysis_carterae.AAC.2